MAQVVLGEQQLRSPSRRPASKRFSSSRSSSFWNSFSLQPERDRHAERAEAARREGEVGLEQPLELQERLVVEDDVVDVAELDAGLGQAVVDRVRGKARIVLLAGEALLLRRGDDAPVLDQRGGAVVVEGRDAEDAHAAPPQNSV